MAEVIICCSANCKYNSGNGYYNGCNHPSKQNQVPYAGIDRYYVNGCKLQENNTRTPKERGADKPKITCLNCKHLMFSDMYGECNKQLRIVKPSDTCEYAEPKERGGEK